MSRSALVRKQLDRGAWRRVVLGLGALNLAFLDPTPLHAVPPRPSDSQVEEWVAAAIADAPRVEGSAIEVSVERGIVRLDGRVPSLASRRYAVREATTVLGVLGVLDRLEVTPADRSDAEIAEDVRSRLESSAAVRAKDLAVSSSGGVVKLMGQVESWARSRQAELLAGEVRGVGAIENRLGVVPLTHRSDSDIAADVSAALARDVYLARLEIGVSVEQGVVTLRGVVGSAFESARAATEARWIPNVRRVDNHLRVVWQLGRSDRIARPLPRTDDQIAAAVDSAFEQDARVDPARVTTRVRSGVVTLSGDVNHLSELRFLEDDARNIVGVAWVVNELRVAPEQRADQIVKRDVERALVSDSELQGLEIDVTVDDGVAALEGEVPSRSHRAHAGNVAARIRGVKRLANRLQIADRNPRDDTAIEQEIQSRFARNGITAPVASRIKIVSVAGVVTLSGDVDRLAERQTAVSIAARTPGIRKVVNRLIVDAYPYPWEEPDWEPDAPTPDWRHYEIDLPFPLWVG